MHHFLCIVLLSALARASPVAHHAVHTPVHQPDAPIVPAAVLPEVPKQEAVIVPHVVPAVPAAPASVPVAEAIAVPAVAPAAAAPIVVPVASGEQAAVVAQAAAVSPVVDKVVVVDEVHAEKNSQDVGILNEPIDKATKLVIDLDDHLKKYLPAEDEIAAAAVTTAPHIYSGSEVGEAEADRQNQMTTLIDQVNRLAESIENTITDLVARRRYVTAAMLRSMLNYVRRVRVNLERLQNRLQSVQAVATSGQNAPPSATAIPGASFFNPIRDRINRLTEEIGSLVTRIRSTFTPGAGTASPLPPLATASPTDVSAAAASIASAVGTMNAAGNVGVAVAASAATSV